MKRFYYKLRGYLRRSYRKVFKRNMEAWSNGLWFFQEFADIYGDSINDINSAEKFFDDFMRETDGNIILDYLDTDNWDCIRKVEIDKQNGLIWFYWQVLDKDPIVNEMRKMAFSLDYYGMCLKFDKVRFIRGKRNRCLGICIYGFTIKERKVESYAKAGGWNIKGKNTDESFFSISIIREKNNVYQHWRFMTTPICSFWLIPKGLGINPQDSEKFLYQIGLFQCEDNLKEAFDSLKGLDKLNAEKQRKRLKAVGNEMRNAAESLFKLILCFYQEEHHFKTANTNYDDMLLKHLTGPLKNTIYTSDFDKERLSEIARIANDLSHDSGNPVTIKEAGLLYVDLMLFVKDFKYRISSKGLDYHPVPKSDKPAAKDYIEEHIEKFCFKDEIASTVSAKSGKASFTIKVNLGTFKSLFHKEPEYYLCNDGFIKKKDEGDLSDVLTIWNRDEVIALKDKIYKKAELICQEKGYDTDYYSLGFSMDADLKKEANPSHLFTEQEIRELMVKADDDVCNKLVIDEDGYAHVIQDPQQGHLYPVSQETWCAGNRYVGKNSNLSDLHDSYVLSLHSWLSYLHYGRRIYDDVYKSDHNIQDVLGKIKEFYKESV